MTTPTYQRERGRLAEALKAVRVGAGLSGARLAEMLGWQQSKVSEIETRKQLPSEDDIAVWVGAVGAAPETASDLLAMLWGARVEYAAWKDAYRESGGCVQVGILELEAQTTRIAEFQPGMISGLLRTSEYAREFLHLACGPLSYGQDEDEIDWMVAKLSEFRLYDDLVIVESIVGEQQLAEADDVARYEKYVELLRGAASTGTEAAAVIRRSLESLR